MNQSNLIYFIIALFFWLLPLSAQNNNFLAQQKKYPRVRTALTAKDSLIKKELKSINITDANFHIYIRIFKMEKILQLWLQKSGVDTFVLFKTYNFCISCGDLGPKRRQGDFQIPEGFYYIDRFNPYSIFYLSLGVNYPNASDRILGGSNPGGDIFIHGDCVTIGCVPITNDKIKELYLYAVYAKNAGQKKIPVHFFPYRFDNKISEQAVKIYTSAKLHKDFWDNLKAGYRLFEKNRRLPKVSVNRTTGKYIFRQ